MMALALTISQPRKGGDTECIRGPLGAEMINVNKKKEEEPSTVLGSFL